MATALHQTIRTPQTHHGCFASYRQDQEYGNVSLRMISKGFKIDAALVRREVYCSRKRNFGTIQASASHATVFDPVSTPPSESSRESLSNKIAKRESNEAALVLIRYRESMWNEKNLFTGCVDVPVTQKGVEEAIEAGIRISNIPVDMIYTSALIRAQMTAMLAMIQHRQKKVPVIMHDENEQARMWSQIFSVETKKELKA